MTAVWIDTGRARFAATAWRLHADGLHRIAVDVETRLDRLALPGDGHHHLTAAATELWVTSSFARLTADRVEHDDRTFDPASAASVAALRSTAGADVVWSLGPVCPVSPAAWTFSSIAGDPGETFDVEVRHPWRILGTSPVERARNLLVRALVDTADEHQIRVDEFEVVRLDTGRYVVVLPGVTDLSDPDPGWNDHHRTVRDLDRAAVASSRSTAVADNRYAAMVRGGLASAGVPVGADLLIVGHSFGADTALDLAADRSFNGPSGYRVSHVVAAAYHSGPQLGHVPSSTEVLVLQNSRDAAVIAEMVGDAHVTEAVASRVEGVGDLVDLDLPGAARHVVDGFGHDIGSLWNAGRFLGSRIDEAADAAAGVVTGDLDRVGRAAVDAVTIDPGVRRPAPGQVVDVFAGGGDGFGHHQRNYVDHLAVVDHPDVLTFLASVGRAGYATDGTALAVDVSVPR